MELLEATDDDFLSLIAGTAPRGLRLPPGGVERPEVLSMLRDLAISLRPSFSPASWLMVYREEIVGLCSIVEMPAKGGISIGYGVAPSRRQMGFGTAAIAKLLQWARTDHRIDRVCADTSINNVGSQRVLELNGFARVGSRVDDEDGELICWSVATTS